MRHIESWYSGAAIRKINHFLLAFCLLNLVSLMLRLRGYNHLQQFVKRWPVLGHSDPGTDPRTISSLCRALDRAVLFSIGPAYCLKQSAVLVCMLRVYGIPAQMILGVNHLPFAAHAWVEVNGLPVKTDPKKWPYPFQVIDSF